MTPLRGLLVTGTDTGVGKTRIAAAIARAMVAEGRSVGVLKPVATGAASPDDADLLLGAIGGGVPRERVVPLHFDQPLAPVVAARLAGLSLEQTQVEASVAEAIAWWSERVKVLVVEGVGGLLCPLAEGTTVADLAVALDYPLVIVARRGLGTLNHTLMTLEVATRRALRVAGVVLNGAEPTSNPLAEATNALELVRRLDNIPLLADLMHGSDLSDLTSIDWFGRAAPSRRSSDR